MPADSVITALSAELIDDLPSFLRDDKTVRAIQHCYARESERLTARATEIRERFAIIVAGSEGLTYWERLLGVVSAADASLESRRVAVLGAYQALSGDASGLTWIDKVNLVMGGVGWTYETHNSADGGSPAVNTIRITVSVPPGSGAYTALERRIRTFTPAHVDLILSSGEGFILDQSQLDQEQFHPS